MCIIHHIFVRTCGKHDVSCILFSAFLCVCVCIYIYIMCVCVCIYIYMYVFDASHIYAHVLQARCLVYSSFCIMCVCVCACVCVCVYN